MDKAREVLSATGFIDCQALEKGVAKFFRDRDIELFEGLDFIPANICHVNQDVSEYCVSLSFTLSVDKHYGYPLMVKRALDSGVKGTEALLASVGEQLGEWLEAFTSWADEAAEEHLYEALVRSGVCSSDEFYEDIVSSDGLALVSLEEMPTAEDVEIALDHLEGICRVKD